MNNAYSLHIGVNRVDPAHYGTDAPLRGCENDARDMQTIARSLGYETEILLTQQATSGSLLERLSSAAATLVAGDTFLLTLACHGSQIADPIGDEADGKDETWCLYDRMLIDDEAYSAFQRFRPGVRIIVVPDSCHSETSARLMIEAQRRSRGVLKAFGLEEGVTFRCIDPFLDHDIFDQFIPFYNGIKRSLAPINRSAGPDVVTLAACMDSQLAGDGAANGLFTENLKRVWGNGQFDGDYEKFRFAIERGINSPAQLPRLSAYGPTASAILASRPFSTLQRGTRDIGDPSGATEAVTRCHIEFPGDHIIGRSSRDVQRYVSEEIAPVLVEACLEVAAGSVAPRSVRAGSRGSWEISCEKSTSGEGKCGVKMGGSF